MRASLLHHPELLCVYFCASYISVWTKQDVLQLRFLLISLQSKKQGKEKKQERKKDLERKGRDNTRSTKEKEKTHK